MRTKLTELLDTNMSFQEVYENLEEQTDDFTLPEGEVAFDHQAEAGIATYILRNHYNNVEGAGYDMIDEDLDDELDTTVFTIKFSDPVGDFDFPDEEVEESLNESLTVKSLLDILDEDPIILLVDDINEYSGEWVNNEYKKDYWDEDDLEEEIEEPHEREKITVSKEDVAEVIHNIQTSPRLTILNRSKNRALVNDYNLTREDQINILKSLAVGDYVYSTISDNALHAGDILTIFFKDVEFNGTTVPITLYVKVDDSVAGDVVIISLHQGTDRYEHPYA